MADLETSVENAKAARERARDRDGHGYPLDPNDPDYPPESLDHPNAPADLDPLEGIRITTAEIDAAESGVRTVYADPTAPAYVVHEDAGPQGETIVEHADDPSDG